MMKPASSFSLSPIYLSHQKLSICLLHWYPGYPPFSSLVYLAASYTMTELKNPFCTSTTTPQFPPSPSDDACRMADALLTGFLGRFLPVRVLLNRRPINREILNTQDGVFLVIPATCGDGSALWFVFFLFRFHCFLVLLGNTEHIQKSLNTEG